MSRGGTLNIGDVIVSAAYGKRSNILDIIRKLCRSGRGHSGVHLSTTDNGGFFFYIVGDGSSCDNCGVSEFIHATIDGNSTRQFDHVANGIIGLGIACVVIIDITRTVAYNEASSALSHDGALHNVCAGFSDI